MNIKKIFSFFTRKIISYGYNTRDKILTITYSNGDVLKYKGECTVWREIPSFKRCSTSKESWLADLYERIKYESNNL